MPSIEVPDLYFTIDVHVDVDNPNRWVGAEPVTYDADVKLAGVTLYTRRYSNDREISNRWTIARAAYAEGKGYDPGPRPPHYAEGQDDARQTVMVDFAEHLKEILGRADPY